MQLSQPVYLRSKTYSSVEEQSLNHIRYNIPYHQHKAKLSVQKNVEERLCLCVRSFRGQIRREVERLSMCMQARLYLAWLSLIKQK
jgi:hypothetical protein